MTPDTGTSAAGGRGPRFVLAAGVLFSATAVAAVIATAGRDGLRLLAGLYLVAGLLTLMLSWARRTWSWHYRWDSVRLDVIPGTGFRIAPGQQFALQVAAQFAYLPLAAAILSTPPTGSGDTTVIGRLLETGLAVTHVLVAVLAAALAILATVSAARALRGRPTVEFTPQALRVLDPYGTRTIPWAALRPGLPVRPPVRPESMDGLVLSLDRPDLVVRSGLLAKGNTVALRPLRVNPLFLIDAIRFYVDHPERRAGIGTRAEYERLLADR